MNLELPAPAREVAAALGVERPVGVAVDVHQVLWVMREAGVVLPDEHGPRISVEPIVVDGRRVEVRLAGRPSGPLPGVVAGASSAYDLRVHDAVVIAVTVSG